MKPLSYDYFDYHEHKTMMVHDEPQSCLVKYPKSDGGYFTVMVAKKQNPIGFTARLPGLRGRK